MLSAKWWPFCLYFNVLTQWTLGNVTFFFQGHTSDHSINQALMHQCFAQEVKLIAQDKITTIISFSQDLSTKVAFCTF